MLRFAISVVLGRHTLLDPFFGPRPLLLVATRLHGIDVDNEAVRRIR